jgi:predicted nucleic acid-binding protein
MPIGFHHTFDEAFLKQAAEFKARHKMSVTDSFLLAQATRLDASVITSDHHEFDAVEQAGLCRFAWMR